MAKPFKRFRINFVLIVLIGVLGQVYEAHVIRSDKMSESTSENVQTAHIENVRSKRTAISRDFAWGFGIVPYEIDREVGTNTIARINAAMSHWEKYTCITFVERNPTEHDGFVVFTEKEDCGCCSSIGWFGRGSRSIGISCADGWIAHELGHAIGFIHEHVRPDRDEYVDILRHNVNLDSAGYYVNFEKQETNFGSVDTLDEPYDLRSIMHYTSTTFSKYEFLANEIETNGGSTWDGKWWTLPDIATILPKKGKDGIVPEIPLIRRLSAIDIRKTNKMYKCSECGRTYLDEKATITSPEFYKKATHERTSYRCQWRIKVMRGDRIQLNINHLDIFKSSDCQSDYLEVRDGYWHKSPLIGRFCGHNIPEHIVSTGNRLIIDYVSSHAGHRGFSANYEATCENDKCRECYQIITDKDDAFSSPNYHDRSANHILCWLLT